MNDDTADRYAAIYHHFSDGEYIALLIVGFASSWLSTFGSLSIMYIVCKKRKLCGRDGNIFHRILFGLSLADFFSSIHFILQPFLVPSYTGLLLAFGNTRTCEIVGFFSIFAVCSHLSSCVLSVYFLLTIRHGWSSKKCSQLLEPWIHVVTWLLPIAIGLAQAFTGVFNVRPVLGVCFTYHYPVDCHVNNSVECERGGALRNRFSTLVNCLSILAALVGIASTWLVHESARRQFRRSERYDFRRSISHLAVSSRTLSNDRTASSCLSIQQESGSASSLHRRAVAKQAIWYTAAFLNSFLPIAVGSVLTSFWTSTLDRLNTLPDQGIHVFIVVIMMYLFFPLQGLLNWFVYIRPSMSKWREIHPERSLLWSYRQILAGRSTPSRTCRRMSDLHRIAVQQRRMHANDVVPQIDERGENVDDLPDA